MIKIVAVTFLFLHLNSLSIAASNSATSKPSPRPRHAQGVREVEATSCDVVNIRVGLGMVTQLVFETSPTQTLAANDTKFSVSSHADAPRSVALTTTITQEAVSRAMKDNGIASASEMIRQLNQTYATNLFVLFKADNQLQFKLHIVPADQSDSIVKVKQVFRKDCRL